MKNIFEKNKQYRCAIYTRKSVSEGLDKDFNTLDAQREAGESYIASQKNEGWTLIEKKYDDGGFTGGNMDRPALKELFDDIRSGLVDIVVVYKVDRLSRSIMDFAKIVELFEAHNVSFVSVTQHFNTKVSMGRLTLNILLSFAQFEREIISERIRDKITASKKRGQWIGGRPFLGYDIMPNGGGLKINQAEAENVRTIFKVYLETRSVIQTLEYLRDQNIKMKCWRNQKGHLSGGKFFTKSGLYYLLRNPAYIGKINYKGEIIDAEFEAIIDEKTFNDVQGQLEYNYKERTSYKVRNTMKGLLAGKLFCGHCSKLMGHRYTRKTDNKTYRYYICQTASEKGWKNCPFPSLPAESIENFVKDEISRISNDEMLSKEVIENFTKETREELSKCTIRICEIEKAIVDIRKKLSQAKYSNDIDLRRDEISHQKALEICREHIQKLENRIKISKSEIIRILKNFDLIWSQLNFKDRFELVDLLIEKVTYYGELGEVVISYRENGIKALEVKDGN